MSYLHELAEAQKNADKIQERRLDEWNVLRSRIDSELENLPPYMQVVFLRGFRMGFHQAATKALPKENQCETKS